MTDDFRKGQDLVKHLKGQGLQITPAAVANHRWIADRMGWQDDALERGQESILEAELRKGTGCTR